jgi:hypothetical protein
MVNCGVSWQGLEDQAVCASNSAKHFFRSTSIRLTFSSFSILIVYIFVLRSCQIGHDRILKPRAAAGERLAAIYTSPWTMFHPIPSHPIAPGTPLRRTRPDATNPPNPPRDIEQFTAPSLHNINLSVARFLRQGPRPSAVPPTVQMSSRFAELSRPERLSQKQVGRGLGGRGGTTKIMAAAVGVNSVKNATSQEHQQPRSFHITAQCPCLPVFQSPVSVFPHTPSIEAPSPRWGG